MAPDWRDPLCQKLAELADAATIPASDRKWLLTKLYEIAELEKTLPIEQRIGALRAVEKFSQKGLTQICTKACSFRKVIVPEHAKETPSVANTESAVARVERTREPKVEKPAKQVIVPTPLPRYFAEPLQYTYGLKFDAEYPPDAVKAALSPFLIQACPNPASVSITRAARAGIRVDLQMMQNIPGLDVLRALQVVPWIKDVVVKPCALFGELMIAAD